MYGISRLVSADLALVKQFLTTFRFFAKPRDILEYLIERYNIPLPQDLLNNTDDIEKVRFVCESG